MSTELPAVEPMGDEERAKLRTWASNLMSAQRDGEPTTPAENQLLRLLARLDAAEANARRDREVMKCALLVVALVESGAVSSSPNSVHRHTKRDAQIAADGLRAALKEGGE